MKSPLSPSDDRFPTFLVVSILLILAALVLRLVLAPVMLFDFDEGIACIKALQLVVRGDWPLYGVRTSLGFHNPPLFIYLVSPAIAFSKSPLFAMLWLQLPVMLAAATWNECLRKASLPWTGQLFLLFALVVPGPLLLTTRIWGHTLIPPIGMATLLILWQMRRGYHPTLMSFLLPTAIFTAWQIHFSGSLFLLASILVLVIFRIRLRWKPLAGGTAVSVLSCIPWLIHQYRTGGQDLRIIWQTVTAHSRSSQPTHRGDFLQAALHTFSDYHQVTAFQEKYGTFLAVHPWISLWQAADFAWWAAALIAAFVAIRTLIRNNNGKTRQTDDASFLAISALVWTLIPLAAFCILHVEPVPAYWLATVPGPALLAGIGFEKIMSPPRRGIPPDALPLRSIAIIRTTIGWCVIAGVASASFIYACDYRKIMLTGNPEYQAYPSYLDQRTAIAWVSDTTHGKQVWLSQELRHDKSGIDFNLLYMLALEEGNGLRLRPSHISPDAIEYIYHNTGIPWPKAEASHYKNWKHIPFGLVSILHPPLSSEGKKAIERQLSK